MATAKITVVSPDLTVEQLNERIMGKGFEAESIFASIFTDEEQWSVQYMDDRGEEVPKTYANDYEK